MPLFIIILQVLIDGEMSELVSFPLRFSRYIRVFLCIHMEKLLILHKRDLSTNVRYVYLEVKRHYFGVIGRHIKM